MFADIKTLEAQARDVWVPRWLDLFSDPAGGFYERLGPDLKPIDMPRRLVTQCRQIMVYAMADPGRYGAKLEESFNHLQKTYDVNGIPVFSTIDRYYDLYALAFVLSACAAHNSRNALAYAARVLEFIQIHFAADIGFHESLGPDLNPRTVPRRQNPHMHLLEGAMAMMQVDKNSGYRALADDMIALFFSRFFDGKNVYEFFDDDLKNPQNHVEAGHHAEWVWLLHRYKTLTGPDPRIDAAQDALWDWVTQHGMDGGQGGVLNAQHADGRVIDGGKRIWPQMETLRAAVVMNDVKTAGDTFGFLKAHYLRDDGLWTESRTRGMDIAADFLPGTTPYHIYPLLKETSALMEI